MKKLIAVLSLLVVAVAGYSSVTLTNPSYQKVTKFGGVINGGGGPIGGGGGSSSGSGGGSSSAAGGQKNVLSYGVLGNTTVFSCTASTSTSLTGCSPALPSLNNGQAVIIKNGGAATSLTAPTIASVTYEAPPGPPVAGDYFSVESKTFAASTTQTFGNCTASASGGSKGFIFYQRSTGNAKQQARFLSTSAASTGGYTYSGASQFTINSGDEGKTVYDALWCPSATTRSFQAQLCDSAGGCTALSTASTAATWPPDTVTSGPAPITVRYPIDMAITANGSNTHNTLEGYQCSGASCTPTLYGELPYIANWATDPWGVAWPFMPYMGSAATWGALPTACNGQACNDDLRTTLASPVAAGATTMTLAGATGVSGTVNVIIDDGPSFQTALNAACPAYGAGPTSNAVTGGTTLIIPPGGYPIGENINVNNSFGCVIQGYGGTGETSIPVTTLYWAGPMGGTVFSSLNSQHATLRDISINVLPGLTDTFGIGANADNPAGGHVAETAPVYEHVSIHGGDIGFEQSPTDTSSSDQGHFTDVFVDGGTPQPNMGGFASIMFNSAQDHNNVITRGTLSLHAFSIFNDKGAFNSYGTNLGSTNGAIPVWIGNAVDTDSLVGCMSENWEDFLYTAAGSSAQTLNIIGCRIGTLFGLVNPTGDIIDFRFTGGGLNMQGNIIDSGFPFMTMNTSTAPDSGTFQENFFPSINFFGTQTGNTSGTPWFKLNVPGGVTQGDNATSGFATLNFPHALGNKYADDNGSGDQFPDFQSCIGACTLSSGTPSTCTITVACFNASRPVVCIDQNVASAALTAISAVPSSGSVSVAGPSTSTDKVVCVQS